MDNNNILNIIKTLTELLHCPACGETYTIDEVQYISQVQGYFMLQVSCRKCRQPVWVNFFVDKNQKPSRQDQKPSNGSEITADEVIEFHRQISHFNGDFKKAFKTKA